MNSNIAILLARLDSKRLPKKHFEKIGDKFLIDHCLDRLKKGNQYKIVLATSDRDIDKPLIDWAIERNIGFYAGDAHDLRKRICGCVEKFNAQFFARVNADSPFIDSNLIDEGFLYLSGSKEDLFTNLYPRSFPYGYSVEIFNAATFNRTVNDNPEAENVTTYFYEHAEKFKIKNALYEKGNFSGLKLTVDTPEDLLYIRGLYESNHKLFDLSLEEIINLVKNKND